MNPTHIAVCICTFKRPHLLQNTLEHVAQLDTGGAFTFSIVIADNDAAESARATVEAFAAGSAVPVRYGVERRQNISLARNKALEMAEGDFVAWIDDDEFPRREWLLTHYRALVASGADGVLGPVQPVFETPPPSWITRGHFFHKPRRATGQKLKWEQTSTANVLIRRSVLSGLEVVFRPQFGSGCEDLDLFKRLIGRGRTFVWCDEAIVTEIIPPTRWTRRYLFRRALLRGRNGRHLADAPAVMKSLIALPLYSLLLPFLWLVGRHVFVRYLMKIGDHSGLLCGVARLPVLGDKYLAG